jgi:hypothetical protein
MRVAVRAVAITSYTRSKAALCPPEKTSVGNPAAASASSEIGASHGNGSNREAAAAALAAIDQAADPDEIESMLCELLTDRYPRVDVHRQAELARSFDEDVWYAHRDGRPERGTSADPNQGLPARKSALTEPEDRQIPLRGPARA